MLKERRYVPGIDKVCESEQELVHMYSVAQFAKQVGISVKTLQRWDREGGLKTRRTLSGRRSSNEADLATALGLPKLPAARRTVAYCRMSSPAGRPDLQNQRAVLSS